MKFFLPVVCSLLLIGCSDSTKTSSPAETPASVQPTAPSKQPVPSTPETAEANASLSVPAPAATSVDGATLFAQKCAACHGSKAEKSALNKSQIIAHFSEQQIIDALHGYQAGTYGKEMKAMMQGQAKPLSDEQINALAQSIPHL